MAIDDRKGKGLDPNPDANRDPITGEPGAHPVGVAGGGTGGALAGAAIGGAVGGPIGAVVGGAIGAVAGGYAGKGAAEAVNPTEEDAYWKGEHSKRPYYRKGKDYDEYQPAYKYGWESASSPENTSRSFEAAEPDLEKNWSTYRGPATTEWRDVRDATRDSYSRVQNRSMAGAAAGTAGAVGAATRNVAGDVGASARNAGDYAGDKADSMWEQMKGNWHQFKGGIKEKWNDLTDDDIEQMDGSREKLVGKIQERYGEAKWKEADIERELRTMNRR